MQNVSPHDGTVAVWNFANPVSFSGSDKNTESEMFWQSVSTPTMLTHTGPKDNLKLRNKNLACYYGRSRCTEYAHHAHTHWPKK